MCEFLRTVNNFIKVNEKTALRADNISLLFRMAVLFIKFSHTIQLSYQDFARTINGVLYYTR